MPLVLAAPPKLSCSTQPALRIYPSRTTSYLYPCNMSSSARPKSARRSSGQNHRNTLSLQRTEVIINVYDLLPPGKVSTVLWAIGSSLLHSGVVIGDREYAYGGHDQRGLTGVYWTKPAQEPPGGTFKQSILHGFSFRPAEELDAIVHQVWMCMICGSSS